MLKNSEKLGQNSIPPGDKQAFRASEVATVDWWNSVSHSGVWFDRPAKTTSNGRRGLLTKEKQRQTARGRDLERQRQLISHQGLRRMSYAEELIKE